MILEHDPDNTIHKGFRKRARFIKRFKEAIWLTNISRAYVKGTKVIYGKEQQVKVGNVVINTGGEQ